MPLDPRTLIFSFARWCAAAICLPMLCIPQAKAQAHTGSAASAGSAKISYLLTPENYHHYSTEFQRQEQVAIGKKPVDPWPWMTRNIPWFESSDPEFQEIYYFRWYSYQKHIVPTEHGDLVNEFLFNVKWAGYGNTVGVAVPHQLREARWLRDPKLADDDARFWFSPLATHNRDFSIALADAVQAVTLATGDAKLGIDLLPAMKENDAAWQKKAQDENKLYFSIDTRDGMEVSISGNGYRPTLNSYMAGDAAAIAAIAAQAGDKATAAHFREEAKERSARVEHELWNPVDQFYEVKTPRGPMPHFAGVRELIGYVPWYFNIPSAEHAVAWKQIYDPEGFAGAFGPPTAERRSPRFLYDNPDQCQWNGYMWGFATTQTLVGMANMLNNQKQDVIGRQDYLNLFAAYVHSHHLRLPSGETIPWLDEEVNPDTGEWVTRRLLAERKSPLTGRGAYYDHSGFADPLITGLIGLRPREDNQIIVNPLLPDKTWTYFALDGLPYHGHILTIIYDQTGQHYQRGAGLTLLVDGEKKASRGDLGELKYTLPKP